MLRLLAHEDVSNYSAKAIAVIMSNQCDTVGDSWQQTNIVE